MATADEQMAKRGIPEETRGILHSMKEEAELVGDKIEELLSPATVEWHERELKDLEEKLDDAREDKPAWYVEMLERDIALIKENLEELKNKEQQEGKGRRLRSVRGRKGTKKVRSKTRRGKKGAARKSRRA